MNHPALPRKSSHLAFRLPALAALTAALCVSACKAEPSDETTADLGVGGAGGAPATAGTDGEGGNNVGGSGGGVAPFGGMGGQPVTGGAGGDTGGAGGAGGGDGGAVVPPGAACDAVIEFGPGAEEQDDGSLSQVGMTGSESSLDGSCVANTGSEVAFSYKAAEAGTFLFYAGAVTEGLDTILYARTTCDDTETELDCNDDVSYPNDINSRIVLDLEAGQEIFLIVDAYPVDMGPQSGEVFLNVGPIARVDRDGECDPQIFENICREGDFCYTEVDEEGLLAETGTCVESTPPELTSGEVFNVGTTAQYVIAGTDSSRDVVALHVQYQLDDDVLETMDGSPAEGLIDPLDGQDVFELDVFTFRARQDYTEEFGIEGPNKVTVQLYDSEGNESEPQTFDLVAAPARAEGEACDEYRLADACPEGTACRKDEAEEGAPATWSCQAVKAPELTSAVAYFNRDNGRISVTFVGIDSDRDVRAPGITLFDPEGVDIPLRSDEMVGEAIGVFEPFEYGEAGEFTAVWRFNLLDADGLALDVGTVLVRVHDAEGLISEPVEATFASTERDVALGDACDDWLAESVCAVGLICPIPEADAPVDGGEPVEPGEPAEPAAPQVCTEVVAECPESFGATALTGDGPSWTASGDTTGAEIHGGGGSCGGGAGDAVFIFTAPAAGTYTFEANSEVEEADTLIYVRSACDYGPEYAGIELECNDDRTPMEDFLGLVEVDLDADQTVYVFVDGFFSTNSGEGWQGAFELVVTAQD